MKRVVDPKYRFLFTTHNGRQYHRKCYWDNLYVFAYNNDSLLVATRVVPFSNTQEALYTAFKGQRGNTLTQHLLPETFQQAQLNVFNNESEVEQFAENISAIVPIQASQLPEKLIEETEAKIEEAASRIMIGQGIEGGLGSFASDETTPFLARDEPTDPTQSIVRDDNEDTALIQMSFRIDEAIKTHLRNTLQANITEGALVKQGDIEFDIAARLYTNPKYLGYVRRLLNAKGSYLSPVVRDFLRFYSRCFNLKFAEHIRQSNDDPDILRKRVESTLGHEKGGTHHHFDYHELTILGHIAEGDPKQDPDDPDKTTYSYKLCSTQDAQTFVLSEIHDKTQRFMIRKFVEHTFNTHHNIKTTQYIDEMQKRKIPIVNRLPDPVEKAIQAYLTAFENWLDSFAPNMIHIAIGALLLSLLGTVGIVLGAFLRLSP